MKIPIVLLHHNEIQYLKKCVDSIIKNTRHPYKLYIVDNNSLKNDAYLKFKKFAIENNIILIENKKDNWLYGFNVAIKNINYPWKKIVLSDSDILIPKIKENKCWLAHLNEQLENYCCIGKLGLALNLKPLYDKKFFASLLTREKSYKTGDKIGNNIIAPVDTTTAIYRRDVFIHDFFMRVGHVRLIRPNYYCCRTSDRWQCEHLGWEKFENTFIKKDIQYKKYVRNKAWFFLKYNRNVEESLLFILSPYERLLLKIFKRITTLVYSFIFVLLWARYIIINFPLNINSLQNKANK